MTRDSAIQWFTELAARTSFQPADDDAVVTISPMFADPVVRYDAIWVAGLHSEALPQPVAPDPFLPLAAQLEAGIPAASAVARLQEARALLDAWQAATDELVLSAPARAEDLELLPSPMLTPWLANEAGLTGSGGSARSDRSPAAPRVPAAQEPRVAQAPTVRMATGQVAQAPTAHVLPAALWLPLRIRREGLVESVVDEVGLEWALERSLPSGTRALDLQNTCPFRAYAELRLGSTELDAPEPGVAPDERGELLHAALQRFWKRVGDSYGLSALSDEAVDELVNGCISEAAPGIWGRTDANRPPALIRECRRTARLIRSLIKLERERAPFRVEDTELGSTLKIAGAQLSMRIDRVDVLEGSGRAILDYKSGQRPTADWYGERPSHPQLLAYLAALGEDVVVMATVNVTAREVRFDGIASSGELLPKVKGVVGPDGSKQDDAWNLRRREWIACVERLAVGFVAGRATVDPKPGACDYCHVKSVCRIADRGIGDPEADTAFEASDE